MNVLIDDENDDQSHHCMLIDEKNLFYVVKNAKIFVILNFFAEIFNFF